MGYYNFKERDEDLRTATITCDIGLIATVSCFSTEIEEMVEYANMGRWRHDTTVKNAEKRYISTVVKGMYDILKSDMTDKEKLSKLEESIITEIGKIKL